jgi:hypothetical protein
MEGACYSVCKFCCHTFQNTEEHESFADCFVWVRNVVIYTVFLRKYCMYARRTKEIRNLGYYITRNYESYTGRLPLLK